MKINKKQLWNFWNAPLYWLYERRLLKAVKSAPLPRHLGMILDGNRRFARQSGLPISKGHELGASKAEEVLDWCLELNISHITMWIFSTENKNRSTKEVNNLFELFEEQALRMARSSRLHQHKVKVKIIGELKHFPASLQQAFYNLEHVTEGYNQRWLNIAVGYGGREEITHAVRRLLKEKSDKGENLEMLAETLTAQEIEKYLYTAGTPDPDFVIRTSGEIRLSGFLLWQAAYSEYYFCDVFWPSFRKLDFLRALRDFQARERRFGK